MKQETDKVKVLIVYKSVHHENTKKIAEAIADILDADLKDPKDVEDVSKYDVIGFGSGIYFTNFHSRLLEFIEDLEVEDKKAFIFSTSGFPNIPLINNFNSKVKEKLEKGGFEVLDSFNCRGFDNYGPFKIIGGINSERPNENDLEDAKKFVESLLKKI